MGKVEYLEGGEVLQTKPLHSLQPILAQIQCHEAAEAAERPSARRLRCKVVPRQVEHEEAVQRAEEAGLEAGQAVVVQAQLAQLTEAGEGGGRQGHQPVGGQVEALQGEKAAEAAVRQAADLVGGQAQGLQVQQVGQPVVRQVEYSKQGRLNILSTAG